MTLDARWSADGVLEGQLVYSDSSASEGNYIRIEVPGDPGLSPLALQTDATGKFRIPLREGYAYTLSADGDEGHRISISVGAYLQAPTPPVAAAGPPIYLVLAVLLMLSLPAAWALQRRDAQPGTAVRQP